MYENLRIFEPISLLYFYMIFRKIKMNSKFFKDYSKVGKENQRFFAEFSKVVVHKKIHVFRRRNRIFSKRV